MRKKRRFAVKFPMRLGRNRQDAIDRAKRFRRETFQVL
ncbi:hypothetical protein D512_02360 [Burkholderia pseudomallei MSHR1043]|nr:hypothetical protein D512_02360 [Burkholderia pseudomallei MSHR1043]